MNATDQAIAERLTGLLDRARAAEAAGRLEDARALVNQALDEPLARGDTYHDTLVWHANLAWMLGDHAAAEASALAAHAVARHRPDVFRVNVLRAEIACDALDMSRAEELLGALCGDDGPLGPPRVERLPEIVAWLEHLRFHDRPSQNLSVLRVEAALAIANLWAEAGRYRSALALVEAIQRDLAAAVIAVDVDQVRLLQVELLLAAGGIDTARGQLASIPTPDAAISRARLELVGTRIALAAGRLAESLVRLDNLPEIPVDERTLFASAAAIRVAVQVELNMFDAAQQTATDAIALLGERAELRPLVALLDGARRSAAARKRSAVALWELPLMERDGQDQTSELARCLDEHSLDVGGSASRFTAAWTAAANAVLLALERSDLGAAARELASLEEITAGVESDYIAARVGFVRTLVAFYGPSPDDCARQFLGIAETLHMTGARLAEAQVIRFAALACARSQRYNDHLSLVTRASAILDEIGSELTPAHRALYMLNKWSGRDELVSALLRDGEGQPPRTTRREQCRVFRNIDELTHWPIDHAFGERKAEQLASDAVADLAMTWVREQLAAPGPSVYRRVSIRSWLSLWWFPRRTLVLHYHVLPDRMYLFRIAHRHIDVIPLPVGRVHLTANPLELVEREADLGALAEALGVASALRQFPHLDRLIVVPHDAIANLPFAAMMVDGRALCEIVPISQVDRLSQLRRGGRCTRRGRFLSIGVSDYSGSAYSDLPNAEAEASAALTALGCNEEPLHSADATVESVVAALPRSTFFHAAAHGSFNPSDPARSGIVLRTRSGGYQTLTLHALRQLDLRRLRLATLATCRSAEAAFLPGRARICIPTALLNAGARGVIASLWPVNDEASIDVMKELYAALRTVPPSHALARVQREAKCSRRDWAGLVFYGSD